MDTKLSLPTTAVYLDFHTSPAIMDLGRDFEPEQFAATFARAAIIEGERIITVSTPLFRAYGAHGNLVYRTLLRNCIRRLWIWWKRPPR